jgi:hypothetical protein
MRKTYLFMVLSSISISSGCFNKPLSGRHLTIYSHISGKDICPAPVDGGSFLADQFPAGTESGGGQLNNGSKKTFKNPV